MAPFQMRSKVCVAPFYVQSKDCKFSPHLEGSNVDFAPHMKESHADFAPHMEQRHSFIQGPINSLNYNICKKKKSSFLSNHLYPKNLYDLCDIKNILRESTFNS